MLHRIPPGMTAKQFSDALLKHERNNRKIAQDIKANYLETGFDDEAFARQNKSITDKLDFINDQVQESFNKQENLSQRQLNTLNVIKTRTPTVAPATRDEQQAMITLAVQEAFQRGQQQALESSQRQGSAQARDNEAVDSIETILRDMPEPTPAPPSFNKSEKELEAARKEFYLAYMESIGDPKTNFRQGEQYNTARKIYGLPEKPSFDQFKDATRRVRESNKRREGSTTRASSSSQTGLGLTNKNHNRLKLLVGSIQAGNRSKKINKELMELIDNMLNKGELTKYQHKTIYKKYLSP